MKLGKLPPKLDLRTLRFTRYSKALPSAPASCDWSAKVPGWNYASTMVAEGPAMRMFARLQAEQVADDIELLSRVVASAVAAGRLPSEALTAIEIIGIPPTLAVRDQMQEAQRFQIEHANGILSPQTWSQRLGLDYEQEQTNFAAHARSANEGPFLSQGR